MTSFSITNGNATTFTDTTPDGGVIINFTVLDNGFNIQVNGVDLFAGGPAAAPNELEFQQNTAGGRTVRFADGTVYGSGGQAEIWQLNQNGASADPIVRLVINPDGTIELLGAKTVGGPLEPLELINGLTVNTAAIAAAWNPSGDNSIVLDQSTTGPTNAIGVFEDLVVCFAAGTLIETQNGSVRVEDLKIADKVLTLDHGYQPIRWIGAHRISAAQLAAQPNLRPVLIRADALGAGFPKQDLIVSPQHRVLVSSAIAKRMFDCTDVLIPANKLLCLDGIDIIEDMAEGVVYYHFLFDRHQIIWSNGTPTESLFTGPEALRSVSAAAQLEIRNLFPECCDPQFKAPAARHIPAKGKHMRKLVLRHQANQKPLFEGFSGANAPD